MGHRWVPWALWALAGLALELAGYFAATDRNWTLSRVIGWVAATRRWVRWAVAAIFVYLWWHWFGG